MEITRKAAQADAAALATAKAVVPSKSTSPKEKGKQVERLPIASTSTATNVFPSTHDSALDDSESEHLNSMDPPAPRAASSRRSSASGSQPPSLTNATSRSPSNLSAHPSHTFGRGLRSPSPAPLPAVHLPLSPKISSVVDSSNIASLPVKQVKKTHNVKLYSDQDSTPFFRRLCWSTDGSLLLTPAGLWEDPYAVVNANFGGGLGAEGGEPKKKKGVPVKESTKDRPKPTVYIYSRANIARPPIAHLPGHQKTSIAIRFSPVLWNLREGVVGENEEKDEENVVRVDLVGEGVEVKLPGSVEEAGGKEGEKRKPASLFDLPYRMVYAVATLDTVYLYDTQQSGPICMFGNIHLLPFTDLAWFVFVPLSFVLIADQSSLLQVSRRTDSDRFFGRRILLNHHIRRSRARNALPTFSRRSPTAERSSSPARLISNNRLKRQSGLDSIFHSRRSRRRRSESTEACRADDDSRGVVVVERKGGGGDYDRGFVAGDRRAGQEEAEASCAYIDGTASGIYRSACTGASSCAVIWEFVQVDPAIFRFLYIGC